jgi:hypothetical protein
MAFHEMFLARNALGHIGFTRCSFNLWHLHAKRHPGRQAAGTKARHARKGSPLWGGMSTGQAKNLGGRRLFRVDSQKTKPASSRLCYSSLCFKGGLLRAGGEKIFTTPGEALDTRSTVTYAKHQVFVALAGVKSPTTASHVAAWGAVPFIRNPWLFCKPDGPPGDPNACFFQGGNRPKTTRRACYRHDREAAHAAI